MLKAVRLLLIWLSFSLLQACGEATPEVTDLSSDFGGGLNVTLIGLPSGSSNQTIFNSVATGSITEYRYKYGDAATTICSDPTGYSAVIPVASLAAIDISVMSDIAIRVCGIGSDGTDWQPFASASVYTWTKDTLAPGLSITTAVASPTNLNSIPVIFSFTEQVQNFVATDINATNCTVTNLATTDNMTFTADIIPASDGVISLSVSASMVNDVALNANTGSGFLGFTYDGTAPQILNITSSLANGSYTNGQIINIDLQFDSVVNVVGGGGPFIWLETGVIDRQATYSAGAGTTTLTFSFVVGSTDYSADLDLVAGSQLFPNGAVISDAAGNIISNLLPIGAAAGSLMSNKALVIIGTPSTLAISEVGGFDYGPVAVGANVDHTFTITQSGVAPITITTGSGIAAPFTFKDGVFPGTGGTCNNGTILNSGANCTVVVTFSPTMLGLVNDTLLIDYNTGLAPASASRSIEGTGAGPAQLTISDGVIYDFGPVARFSVAQRTFTITNIGPVTATGINTASLTAPFEFQGGAYPGTGGDCGPNLAASASCTISVTFEPLEMNFYFDTIVVNYSSGSMFDSVSRAIQGTGGVFGITVQPVYGTNFGDTHTNWNDYIKFNDVGQDANHQDVEACDGSEIGYYGEFGGCIHSGEKRKVVISGYSSCTNLTMDDINLTFDWNCDDSSGTATFYTRGLKPGKGLRDLITGTGSWTQNYVIAKDNGIDIATSQFQAWWTNPIMPLPSPGVAQANLTAVGTIYYVNSIASAQGYLINADKISIVSLGGATINNGASASTDWCNASLGGTSAPTTNALICGGIGGRRFVWIEANFNGFSGTSYSESGIVAVDWRSSRINNTSITSLSVSAPGLGAGVAFLGGFKGSLITGLDGYLATTGLYLATSGSTQTSEFNTFRDVRFTKVGSGITYGLGVVSLKNNSNRNRFYNLKISDTSTSSGSVSGILIESGRFNIFSKLNISNMKNSSQGQGIHVATNLARDNMFSEFVISGSSNAAVVIGFGDNNLFSHATAANNTFNSIYFTNSPTITGNTFNSFVGINSNIPIESQGSTASVPINRIMYSAFSTMGSANMINTGLAGVAQFSFLGYTVTDTNDTCLGNHHDLDSSCDGPSTVEVEQSSGNWFGSSVVGRTFSDDSINIADVSGSALYTSLDTISKWLDFDSFFRSWGQDNSFGPISRGPVLAGNSASIWDWSAQSMGILYDNSYAANSGNNPLVTNGGLCGVNNVDPTPIVHTFSDATTISFIRNAIEFNDDLIGNNNGFCEVNETCVYAPHIGAYQGGSPNSSEFCTLGSIRIMNPSAY
jgi:hypothetical protein